MAQVLQHAVVRHEVVETGFSFYSDEERRNDLGAVKILSSETLNANGRPVRDGLYDSRMGPLDFDDSCYTCNLRYASCPGHPGYIELDVPVYYPILFNSMFQLLRCKCFYCHHMRMSKLRCRYFLVKLKLLEMGDIVGANDLESILQPPQIFTEEDADSMGGEAVLSGGRKAPSSSRSGENKHANHSVAVEQKLRIYEQRYAAFIAARSRQNTASAAASANGSSCCGRSKITEYQRALQIDAIEAFLKTALAVKRCENCGGVSPAIRKDGFTKIFQRPLPKRDQAKMNAENFKLKRGLDTVKQLLESAHRQKGLAGKPLSNAAFDISEIIPSPADASSSSNSSFAAADVSAQRQAAVQAAFNGTSGEESEVSDDASADDNDAVGNDSSSGKKDDSYLVPTEVEAQLQLLWLKNEELLNFIWSKAMSSTAALATARALKNDSAVEGPDAPGAAAVAAALAAAVPTATAADKAASATADAQLLAIANENCSRNGWRIFFTRVVLVPPNRFRAAGKMDGNRSAEHPQNQHLKRVIQFNETLRSLFDPTADTNTTTAAVIATTQPSSSSSSNSNSRRSSGGSESAAATTAAAEEAPAEDGLDMTRIVSTWISLQNSVNSFMDSSKDANVLGESPTGIRQLLEKKEGLFRRHMMGKRVNFCCRSVISPDPNLGTNEIGIPVNFAMSLHYPTPVNSFNVKHLRTLVERGPFQYPGANRIETADGRMIALEHLSKNERAGKAKLLMSNPGIKVHRHLVDGDVLLVNRQPTLHKPGIMAHKARVLQYVKEQTLRMHYANCNTYNADFDGDEMNCHFVQSELARAEATYLCNTDHQYISCTNGGPLRGLIQDHVASGVKLTCKDTFLTRAEFQQLLYIAVTGLPGTEVITHLESMHMPPPAIFKPVERWTGKQVISALLSHLCRPPLPQLQLDGKTKTPAVSFGEEHQEHVVVFRGGQLLSGVMDKAAMGASSLGIVHTIYELYGPELAGRILSAFGRLFTFHLQNAGHSCGIQDLTLTERADEERRQLLRKVSDDATQCLLDLFDMKETPAVAAVDPDAEKEQQLELERATSKYLTKDRKQSKVEIDSIMQSAINESASAVIKACLPNGLERSFLQNHFSLMVNTGAKGSSVNQSQITCFLGQQALEGQRVPLMISGKSLPSFRAFEPSARAGGFVQDRFLTGVKPQEYYFHCMAGREGLVDTAVKTARSGYLQRCLVKHLEGLKVNYDMTVRDSASNVIQFLYGEDGLDPVSAPLLGGDADQMRFIARNNQALVYKYNMQEYHSMGMNIDLAKEHHSRMLKAKQLVEASNGEFDTSQIVAGSVVLVRRKKSPELHWSRTNVLNYWVPAVVLKARHNNSSSSSSRTKSHVPYFDVQYLSDGLVEKKLPAMVMFPTRVGAGGGPVHSASTSAILPSSMTIGSGSGQSPLHLIKPGLPDPAMNALRLDVCVGACSEKVQSAIRDFIAQEGTNGVIADRSTESTVTGDALELLVWVKYLCSMACPGEAVGCIAAQSVGEPSTQMTLNTFHLAGHGGANVTLGIPRLREIIMTASKALKTPTMFMPMARSNNAADAKSLARKLSRLPLSKLLSHRGGVEVGERLCRVGGDTSSGVIASRWERVYRLRFYFEPNALIEDAFGVNFAALIGAIKGILLPKLDYFIKLEQRRAGESASGGVQNVLKRIRGATNAAVDAPGSAVAAAAARADTAEEGEEPSSGRSRGRKIRDVMDEEVDPDALGAGSGLPSQRRNVDPAKSASSGGEAVGGDSDEDDSDDEDDRKGENNDDLGNMKLRGAGREQLGYDDDESDEDDAADADGGNSDVDSTDHGDTDHVDEDTDMENASTFSKPASSGGKKSLASAAAAGKIFTPSAATTTASSSSSAASKTKSPKAAATVTSSSVPDTKYNKLFSFGEIKFNAEESFVEVDLSFHSKARRLLMIQLVEKAAELTMVRATKNISNAYAVEEDGCWGVQTEGVNFEALWAIEEQLVRTNAIKSNDIHAMLMTYGVEAARQSIVDEIKNVFGVYGINVDPRHLSLIADFMTRNGQFSPLNRMGMMDCPSPFQQMSFESTCTFLTRAAKAGCVDNLQSPSARIVLGSVSKVGTGCFDLLLPLQKHK